MSRKRKQPKGATHANPINAPSKKQKKNQAKEVNSQNRSQDNGALPNKTGQTLKFVGKPEDTSIQPSYGNNGHVPPIAPAAMRNGLSWPSKGQAASVPSHIKFESPPPAPKAQSSAGIFEFPDLKASLPMRPAKPADMGSGRNNGRGQRGKKRKQSHGGNSDDQSAANGTKSRKLDHDNQVGDNRRGKATADDAEHVQQHDDARKALLQQLEAKKRRIEMLELEEQLSSAERREKELLAARSLRQDLAVTQLPPASIKASSEAGAGMECLQQHEGMSQDTPAPKQRTMIMEGDDQLPEEFIRRHEEGLKEFLAGKGPTEEDIRKWEEEVGEEVVRKRDEGYKTFMEKNFPELSHLAKESDAATLTGSTDKATPSSSGSALTSKKIGPLSYRGPPRLDYTDYKRRLAVDAGNNFTPVLDYDGYNQEPIRYGTGSKLPVKKQQAFHVSKPSHNSSSAMDIKKDSLNQHRDPYTVTPAMRRETSPPDIARNGLDGQQKSSLVTLSKTRDLTASGPSSKIDSTRSSIPASQTFKANTAPEHDKKMHEVRSGTKSKDQRSQVWKDRKSTGQSEPAEQKATVSPKEAQRNTPGAELSAPAVTSKAMPVVNQAPSANLTSEVVPAVPPMGATTEQWTTFLNKLVTLSQDMNGSPPS